MTYRTYVSDQVGSDLRVAPLEKTMHPATAQLLRHFKYEHLPARLQAVSRPVCELAHTMANTLPDDPEVTVGLRKLLEAKDCLVRAELTRDLGV